MDPTVCLQNILNAIVEHQVAQPEARAVWLRREATDALFDLALWLQKGGAMPVVSQEDGKYQIG